MHRRKRESLIIFKQMEQEKQIATRIDIVEGTPFNVATFTETTEKEEITTCRIAVGNQIVTAKVFETFEDAVDYINEKPWELIVATAMVIVEKACGTK